MSAPKTYYIKGRFEGHFKTKQRSFLKPDDPFPKGDEHLVQIYRGIVSQSEEIQLDDFSTHEGFYNFTEIQNIQVNTSEHWPIPNDRIFSLTNAKLVNVKVSNVQFVNDQTLGEIQGDIVSQVIDGKNKLKEDEKEPDEPENDKGSDNQNDDSNNNNNNNGGGGTENDQDNDDGTIGGGGGGTSKKGCFNWFPNFSWLRWLLYLLAILLLLYILGRCTQLTQKIYCKIKDRTVVEKLNKVRLQNDSLENKIAKTTMQEESCGGVLEQSVTNLPWSKLINLGENSGDVIISFDAFKVPDRLEVIYNGKLIVESDQFNFEPLKENNDHFSYLKKYGGFSQGLRLFKYHFEYKKDQPTEVLYRVIPNRMYKTTLSDLKASCPQ